MLQDISRAGAPATVPGSARLDPAGQPPFRYEIDYDDAAIGPRGRYAVREAPVFLLPELTPIEPRPFLAGMFTYIADTPSIVLCADRRSVPVAMEADYKALEAAYCGARAKPGERLPVRLEGQLALCASMEDGQPPGSTLVVERFVGIWPGQRCGVWPSPSPGPRK